MYPESPPTDLSEFIKRFDLLLAFGFGLRGSQDVNDVANYYGN